MEDGHAKTAEEVLKFFGTNEEVGLSSDQVKNLQAKYGPNGKCEKAFVITNYFVLGVHRQYCSH